MADYDPEELAKQTNIALNEKEKNFFSEAGLVLPEFAGKMGKFANIIATIQTFGMNDTGLIKDDIMIKILSKSYQKMILHYQDKEEQYIIKVVREFTEDTYNEIVHEAIVGFYGVNLLGSRFFAKTIAAIYPRPGPRVFRQMAEETNREEFESSGEIYDDYSKIDNCAYLFIEYIPGMEFTNWLEEYLENLTVDREAALRKILQEIILAIYDANTRIGFTHYDLDPRNIIIRSDGYPVIIDYGISHIRYQGQDYGWIFSETEVGLEVPVENREKWYTDMYNLLMKVYRYVSLDAYLGFLQEKQISIQRNIDHYAMIIDVVENNRPHKDREHWAKNYLNFKKYSGKMIKESIIYQERYTNLKMKSTRSVLEPILVKLIAFFGCCDSEMTAEKYLQKYLQIRQNNPYVLPTLEMKERMDNKTFKEFIDYFLHYI